MLADESIISKKRKRKTHSSNNPLSDARRQQHRQQNSKKKRHSQAPSKTDLLWHRKSGAGYALFLKYYGEQPPGVVVTGGRGSCTECCCDAATGGRTSATTAPSSRKTASMSRGVGQSRAAKRRAKKKRKRGTDTSSTADDDIAKVPDNQQQQKAAASNLLHCHCAESQSAPAPLPSSSSPKLLEAFASTQNRYAHLVPYMIALSKPLPLTFRLRRYTAADHNDSAHHQLLHSSLMEKLSTPQHSALVAPVLFDPSGTIYQSTNLSKATLSKVSPSLKSLLVEYSTNGTLARQEFGSMLPVLALSAGGWLSRGNRVLDMCASPGSKTLQALEVVASSAVSDATTENAKEDASDTIRVAEAKMKKLKKGRVVANDVHQTRLASLQEAVGRSGLPSLLTSRVIYTNFDATVFPFPTCDSRRFDVIIADVPCSGDGTIRKDPYILPMWTPATGNALHNLQLCILMRALELVRVGGVVCYSTCSLNPVEDEAVVSAALIKAREEAQAAEMDDDDNGNRKDVDSNAVPSSRQPPAVELVEWPDDLLPGLVRRAGVCNWKVADHSYTGEKDNDGNEEEDDFVDLRWHATYEDAVDAGMANAEPTMWPPVLTGREEEVADQNNLLQLERCIRLWPQDQDTGGFFVALIRKNRPLLPPL